MCHLDLWADNVLPTREGRICVIDFDNGGAADPDYEPGGVVFEFWLSDPARARTLHDAYAAAGGPARLSGPADFSMAVSQLANITVLAIRRWVEATGPAERARSEARVRECLDDPLTVDVVHRILAAVV